MYNTFACSILHDYRPVDFVMWLQDVFYFWDPGDDDDWHRETSASKLFDYRNEEAVESGGKINIGSNWSRTQNIGIWIQCPIYRLITPHIAKVKTRKKISLSSMNFIKKNISLSSINFIMIIFQLMSDKLNILKRLNLIIRYSSSCMIQKCSIVHNKLLISLNVFKVSSFVNFVQ
jgi:hypothetical protein